jgi:RNA ligase
VKVHDLFDPADLAAAIEAGYVRVQTHPNLPLLIHNYTEHAQFDRHWTPVTTQCRGLIVHAETGEVLARPFPKVHNHTEPEAPVFGLDEPVSVADKVDGSLAIGYPIPEGTGYAIATRGSFASDQAVHATAVWNARYADTVTIPPGVTPLWEIIYPANRIVVDYGGLDDLVLLAGVHIESGEFVMPHQLGKAMGWPGPVVETFPYDRFTDVLASEPRDGKEGFVVRSVITGRSAKFKYAEYVRLHRIVTGLNARGLWELIGAGKTVADVCVDLPDEFHQWVTDVASELEEQVAAIKDQALAAYAETRGLLPDEFERKDFAMLAAHNPMRAYLFKMLDGRPIHDMAWKAVRPAADWTPAGRGRTFTEEAA